MELDITDFFLGCDDPQQYSASVVELGERAGQITWANAYRDAEAHPLLRTTEEIAAAQKYFASMGAWSDHEIRQWSLEELNALLIQLIAGTMREGNLDSHATPEDWEYYDARAYDGQVSGNLFKSDDGRIYYTIEG